MSGLKYDSVVSALKAAGLHDAVKVVDQVRDAKVKMMLPRRRRQKANPMTYEQAVDIHKLYHGAGMSVTDIAIAMKLNISCVSYTLSGRTFPEAAQHYGV